MDGMFNMMKRITSGTLALGLALWAPGARWALAQVEITPEIREACQSFDPAIRDIALNEVLPSEAELKVVETTAVAIHETGQGTAKLEVPDAAKLQEKLTGAGVSAQVAQDLAQRTQATLKDAQAAFAAGDPGKAGKVLEGLRETLQKGGVDLAALERIGGGSSGFERIAFARDGLGTAMEAHFQEGFKEMASRGGAEGGLSPEAMKGMMEKMTAAGYDPGKVMQDTFRGPMEFQGQMNAGEFHGPGGVEQFKGTPEYAAHETMFREMGQQMEKQMREFGAQMEHYGPDRLAPEGIVREGMYLDPRTMDPRIVDSRAETSGRAELLADAGPRLTGETFVSKRDLNNDGKADEYTYRIGVVDHVHPNPHTGDPA